MNSSVDPSTVCGRSTCRCPYPLVARTPIAMYHISYRDVPYFLSRCTIFLIVMYHISYRGVPSQLCLDRLSIPASREDVHAIFRRVDPDGVCHGANPPPPLYHHHPVQAAQYTAQAAAAVHSTSSSSSTACLLCP
jgi:hypothetical protein